MERDYKIREIWKWLQEKALKKNKEKKMKVSNSCKEKY